MHLGAVATCPGTSRFAGSELAGPEDSSVVLGRLEGVRNGRSARGSARARRSSSVRQKAGQQGNSTVGGANGDKTRASPRNGGSHLPSLPENEFVCNHSELRSRQYQSARCAMCPL